jgi:nitrogen fixation NifU-like protein
MSSVYEEHVMDHYKHPRNRGELEQPDVTVRDTNPLCGDKITVQLVIRDDTIEQAKFQAGGCALSQAGASILFERLPGMSVTDARAYDKQHILDEFGTALSVSRIKCALLALSAVKKALVEYQKEHSAGVTSDVTDN